jgi:hypothetical protein
MKAILTVLRGNENVICISISFMAKDVEQLVMNLLAIFTSFENSHFN